MGSSASVVRVGTSHSLSQEECNDLAIQFANYIVLVKSGRMNWQQVKSMITEALVKKQMEVLRKSNKKACIVNPESLPSTSADESKDDGNKNEPNRVLLVAVDGSVAADVAYKSSLIFRRKLDRLILFHAFQKDLDVSKPVTFQPRTIQKRYESNLLKDVPSEYCCLEMCERADGVLSKDVICDRLSASNLRCHNRIVYGNNLPNLTPSLLFLGYSGKRGEITQQFDLGTTTRCALHHAHIPVFICKKLLKQGPRSVVYGMDSTELSQQQGLSLVISLLQPRDSLRVIHVTSFKKQHEAVAVQQQQHHPPSHKHNSNYNSVNSASIEQQLQSYCEQEFELYGLVNAQFTLIEKNPSRSLAESIVSAVNEDYQPDLLVLSPRAQETITSITEQVVIQCECTVILFKT